MYERLGSAGIALLERIVAYAHERGVIVILDGKRNDIGSTAEAYAEAYLAPDSPNPVECLTVNPYMGVDTLEPYLKLCRSARPRHLRAGQDQQSRLRRLPEPEDRQQHGLWQRGAGPGADRRGGCIGPETGWSSLGVVVGATYPQEAADIRTLLPKALFLIPGFGYQGGELKQFVAALVPGPAGREGGLINSARATLFPAEAADGDFATWKSAFADTLVRHIAAVADASRI